MIDAGGADFTLELKDKLSRDLKSVMGGVASEMKAFARSLQNEVKLIGHEIQAMGKDISKIGLGITGVGAASVYGLGKAVSMASNLRIELAKFDTVFGGQSSSVHQWAKDFAQGTRQAETEVIRFLSTAQDLLVPIGFDRDEAAAMSITITNLATDLAAFNKDISKDEAMRSLLGGLTGESENLKKFGVIAGDAAMKAQALSMGFDPKNLTATERVLSMLTLTLAGTTDAQGKGVEMADEYENALSGLRAEGQKFSELIGGTVRQAVTNLVIELTDLAQGFNNVLSDSPKIRGAIAAMTVGITGLGVAITAIGTALSGVGGTVAIGGLFVFGPAIKNAIKLNGVVGTLKLGLWKTGGAIRRLATGFTSIGGVVKAVGKSISSLFVGGMLGKSRIAMAAVKFGFKGLFSVVTGGAIRLLPLLVNPWVAATAAIGAAAYAAAKFFNIKPPQFLVDFWNTVRGAGETAVNFMLPKSKGDVEVPAGPKLPPLTELDRELAKVIRLIRSPMETFRENVKRASNLLDRGEITRDEFGKFYGQEVENFRQATPEVQQREALREQVMTPLEVFGKAILDAKALVGTNGELFERARQAAVEQFKANDKATQWAMQLRTPLEMFEATVREAKDLFGEGTENFKRATAEAANQFKLSNPATQMMENLRTPIEVLREDLANISKVVAGAPLGQQDELRNRATKDARERFMNNDPQQQAAKGFREQFKSMGAKLAETITEISDLAKSGVLSGEEARRFAFQARNDAFGERPEAQSISESILSTNAAFASQFGAFAPTISDDRQNLEFDKKRNEILADMDSRLRKIAEKRGRLGK